MTALMSRLELLADFFVAGRFFTCTGCNMVGHDLNRSARLVSIDLESLRKGVVEWLLSRMWGQRRLLVGNWARLSDAPRSLI